MATIDRNKLEPGTKVRWLNNGWVIGEIAERIQGTTKVIYRAKPIDGMKAFGGASHTTGWTVSMISADCLVDLGPDSEDTLSPADLHNTHGQSALFHSGQLDALPEYVPQDRNMYAVWREQAEKKRADALAAGTPIAESEAPVEVRVRTRVRPGATA
jgi:hypothetical protein